MRERSLITAKTETTGGIPTKQDRFLVFTWQARRLMASSYGLIGPKRTASGGSFERYWIFNVMFGGGPVAPSRCLCPASQVVGQNDLPLNCVQPFFAFDLSQSPTILKYPHHIVEFDPLLLGSSDFRR